MSTISNLAPTSSLRPMRWALPVVLVLAGACGGAKVEIGTPSNAATPAGGAPVAAVTAKGFTDALQSMVAHDKASDWNDATCVAVAKAFLDVAATQKADTKKDFPEALYNAGLAYQRCAKDGDAKAQFSAALAADPKQHRSRAALAMYDYREKGEAALDGAIGALQQAVRDAEFQNVEALVNLATLQMKRNGTSADNDGASDFDRAKKNLQRALAIDDGFQPAFNQLALYYLETARQKAGKKTAAKSRFATFQKTKRVDVQQLELAALVCSQAIRKNPNYAPVHNTAGLIQVELENINGAVKEFEVAARLDATFFEAQMNYASINLSFRGFKAAEDAYRAALKIRPNDYDAHLGLALALRGQIDDSNFDKYVADALAEIEACKKLSADRPEAYYNEAILTEGYRAKGDTESAIPMLELAATTFEAFVAKAGATPEYADAVKRAKDRARDIRDTVKFIKEGQTAAAIEAARVEKETAEAQAEAAAQGDGGAPAPAAPADADGGAAPAAQP